LFAGLLAALEHLAAFYLVDLLNQVPYLRGTRPGPVLLFAFFEYQVYWAAALWLAWLLLKLAALRAK